MVDDGLGPEVPVADRRHVLSHHVPDCSQQRGNIFAVHERPALRIEHLAKFVGHEGHIATTPEDRRNHPRESDSPLEVVHVLGVDENLEWALGAFVHIDLSGKGDIESVGLVRPLQLVGLAGEHLRPAVGVSRNGGVLALLLGNLRSVGFRHFQHRPGNVIGPVSRAALTAQAVGLFIDVPEVFEGNILGDVDRLGDGAVDPMLSGGLHAEVVFRKEFLCRREVFGKLGAGIEFLVESDGVVDDLFFDLAAIGLQDLPGVAIGEDRLHTRRDVARVKADCPGRRNRREQSVADAMLANVVLHFQRKTLSSKGARAQEPVGVEHGERALLFGQFDRRRIGSKSDCFHPFGDLGDSLGRAILDTAHGQGICKACHTKADPTLGTCFEGLLFDREEGRVHHVVHHPHCSRDQMIELVDVEFCHPGEGH